MAPVLILGWALLAIVTAVVAKSRGRSGFGWFLIGVLFGPLGLVIALALSRQTRCRYCAERIRAAAIRCRHCGSYQVGVPSESTAVPVEASAPETAFHMWLREQGVAPETLSEAQHEQLRAAYDRSTLSNPSS